MTSHQTIEQQSEIRVLDITEVDGVAGGLIGGVDVSQMPDRSVGGCGTMWWQRELIKILTGGRA